MSFDFENDLILRAARGELTERTPVWLMRQAGRILKEYRVLRAKVSGFKELVETPKLAAEVTIQPIRALEVDAAIIFSDILVIPEAMGLPYTMLEKTGPYFKKTIQSRKEVDNLHDVVIDRDLHYVISAIKIAKKELNGKVPLIGFCGAPWTIFCYMVEGHGSKTFSKARKLLYTNPVLSCSLLQKITDATILYLKAQINAGADMVQVFDSWAGILNDEQYKYFALSYINQICNAITNVPVTIFAKGAYGIRKELGELPCNTIGLDWNMDIAKSKKLMPNKTLQGNLDPCVLYAAKNEIKKETEKMLKSFGTQHHIANLGHGVYPDTDINNVKYFIDLVKNYKYN